MLVVLAAVLGPVAVAEAKPRLLETVEVTGINEPSTRTVLQKEQTYIIEIRGAMTNPDGSGADALYCFGGQGCPKPSRQLGTVGMQIRFDAPAEVAADKRYHLTDLAKLRRISYEPSHVYRERFRPRNDGRMLFLMTGGGEAGKMEVRIYAGGELDLKMETKLKPRLEKPERGRVPPFFNTRKEVAPDTFELLVDIKRPGFGKCTPDRHRFKIGKRSLKSEELDRCEYLVEIPEGVHQLEVRAGRGEDALIGEQEVVVQDWLVVGIGDSVGSGEGNPDVAIRGDRDDADWQSRRCHRSHHSHQAQAARRLEALDDDTSVTFVHLSCSGASIAEGLLGGYEGIEKGSATNLLDPQVPAFLKLVDGREVDAVLISIGANDLKFGSVLKHCVLKEACVDATFLEGATLRNWITNRLGSPLLRLYKDLGAALGAGKVGADRVFVTGYPKLLYNQDGTTFCGQVLRNAGVLMIDSAESQWLQTEFADQLNQSIFYSAVGLNRWAFVSGYVDRFRTHGYCASPSARWVVTQGESESGQDNADGSMHPNEDGHDIMGRDVFKTLKEELYTKGRPRVPRGPGIEEDEGEGFLDG